MDFQYPKGSIPQNALIALSYFHFVNNDFALGTYHKATVSSLLLLYFNFISIIFQPYFFHFILNRFALIACVEALVSTFFH
ncbi:MAG: hypothetical protein EA341_02350 [Mongoliibacter sp.]|nr:MAG: hypothetical protein EA341_02350 [Mongoliibacter sp.]